MWQQQICFHCRKSFTKERIYQDLRSAFESGRTLAFIVMSDKDKLCENDPGWNIVERSSTLRNIVEHFLLLLENREMNHQETSFSSAPENFLIKLRLVICSKLWKTIILSFYLSNFFVFVIIIIIIVIITITIIVIVIVFMIFIII